MGSQYFPVLLVYGGTWRLSLLLLQGKMFITNIIYLSISIYLSLSLFLSLSLSLYIYIYINFVCLNMKMSNQNLLKKTFFYINPVIFWFVQKPSKDCALNKKCKNYIYLNNSKNTKEQLKVE